MGKSVVLKDMKGRPQGYLREAQGGIFCRAALDQPAQAMISFADGMQTVCELKPAKNEQMLACEGKQLRAACIFRDAELLFVTDEAARQMYDVLQAGLRRKRKADISAGDARTMENASAHAGPADSGMPLIRYDALPCRRWPPPPCWDTALYKCGRWTDIEKPSV